MEDPPPPCAAKNCTQPGTLTCRGCKEAKYCSQTCQAADWKTHKKACPVPALLHEQAQELTLDPSTESKLLKRFVEKMRRNANWAAAHQNDSQAVPVLLDATRAMVVTEERFFDRNLVQGQAAWQKFLDQGCPFMWKAVAAALSTLSTTDAVRGNTTLARELYQAHQAAMRHYGSFDGLIQLCCTSTTWPAMVRLRREREQALEPTRDKLETVWDAFQSSLNELEEIGFPNAPRETIERMDLSVNEVDMEDAEEIWIQFKASPRIREFHDLVLAQLVATWESVLRAPMESRYIYWAQPNILKYPSIEYSDQIDLLAVIANVSGDTDMTSIYAVFMEVKKRLRYCFEDAVDPDDEIVNSRRRPH